MTNFTFKNISIGDKEKFEKILKHNDLYCNLPDSELTFQNLLIWNSGERAFQCEVEEGILVLYRFRSGHQVFFPPFVKKKEDFLPAVEKIREYCRQIGDKIDIERIPEPMYEILKEHENDGFLIEEDRNDFEYLYDPKDLIELKGKKFNSKRNFLHGFQSSYDYRFVDYDDSRKQEVLDFVRFWAQVSEKTDYEAEYAAIETALTYWKELDLYCDCLLVGEKLAGFSIGFINDFNTGIVMFEKADTSYRGSYAAINQHAAEAHFSGCTLINRQEDMGIEGLRKAKMSYHPVRLAKKYNLK